SERPCQGLEDERRAPVHLARERLKRRETLRRLVDCHRPRAAEQRRETTAGVARELEPGARGQASAAITTLQVTPLGVGSQPFVQERIQGFVGGYERLEPLMRELVNDQEFHRANAEARHDLAAARRDEARVLHATRAL